MQQPLVSILIPVTGNPIYLELALTSTLLQTYQNIEIIIRDPSPTDEIQLLLEREFLPYTTKIIYIRDFKYRPRNEIFQMLINESNGEYLNFLEEKDLFYPTKIEKMMQYFMENPTENVSIITCNSSEIDKRGHLIRNSSNSNHNQNNIALNGIVAGNLIFKNPKLIKGLSKPLFKKKALIYSFGQFSNKSFIKESEFAFWLTLLSQGNYISVTHDLLFERVDTMATSTQIDTSLIQDWISLFQLGELYGFLNTTTARFAVIHRILNWIDKLLLNQQNILFIKERKNISRYKSYLDELLKNN